MKSHLHSDSDVHLMLTPSFRSIPIADPLGSLTALLVLVEQRLEATKASALN